MNRKSVIRKISRRLEQKSLVFFGTRGDDIAALKDLPELHAAYSFISAYDQQSRVSGRAIEDISGIRVDLDAYDIDTDADTHSLREFRARLLTELASPSVVFTYRPSRFLSSICFSRSASCDYLGMFKDHQWAFEHKPWVEESVGRLGIPRVEWRFVADEDRHFVLPMLDKGPIVLRRSHSSGGRGLALARDEAEVELNWPNEQEAFVSVAPYIESSVPVNVGAVIWDRDVTVHYPSVQLIGIPELTSIPFGFCGSDFSAALRLSPGTIDEIEQSTRRIGSWMQDHGYRGAFGVDFLVKDERALFMEVNPRFQGSTNLSCAISYEMAESCLMTDHLAALLHLAPPAQPDPLSERMRRCPPMAQFVQHLSPPSRSAVSGYAYTAAMRRTPGFVQGDVLASERHFVQGGATVARITFSKEVTESGYALHPEISSVVRAAQRNSHRENGAVSNGRT